MRLVLCALSFAPCGARCAAPNCTTPTAIDLPDAPCHVRLVRQAWYIWPAISGLQSVTPCAIKCLGRMPPQRSVATRAKKRAQDARSNQRGSRHTLTICRQIVNITTRQTDTASRHGRPTWRTERHDEASYGRRHMGCFSGVICGTISGASHTEPMEIDPKNPR